MIPHLTFARPTIWSAGHTLIDAIWRPIDEKNIKSKYSSNFTHSDQRVQTKKAILRKNVGSNLVGTCPTRAGMQHVARSKSYLATSLEANSEATTSSTMLGTPIFMSINQSINLIRFKLTKKDSTTISCASSTVQEWAYCGIPRRSWLMCITTPETLFWRASLTAFWLGRLPSNVGWIKYKFRNTDSLEIYFLNADFLRVQCQARSIWIF